MKSLDEAWAKKSTEHPITDKYQALIMASIIEKPILDSELGTKFQVYLYVV